MSIIPPWNDDLDVAGLERAVNHQVSKKPYMRLRDRQLERFITAIAEASQLPADVIMGCAPRHKDFMLTISKNTRTKFLDALFGNSGVLRAPFGIPEDLMPLAKRSIDTETPEFLEALHVFADAVIERHTFDITKEEPLHCDVAWLLGERPLTQDEKLLMRVFCWAREQLGDVVEIALHTKNPLVDPITGTPSANTQRFAEVTYEGYRRQKMSVSQWVSSIAASGEGIMHNTTPITFPKCNGEDESQREIFVTHFSFGRFDEVHVATPLNSALRITSGMAVQFPVGAIEIIVP